MKCSKRQGGGWGEEEEEEEEKEEKEEEEEEEEGGGGGGSLWRLWLAIGMQKREWPDQGRTSPERGEAHRRIY